VSRPLALAVALLAPAAWACPMCAQQAEQQASPWWPALMIAAPFLVAAAVVVALRQHSR